MGRLLWLAAALGAVGCGKVSLVPDAAIDGPDLDAFSCPTAKLACSAAGTSSCVDPMTDKMNCGACGTTCGSGEDCAAGHCADTTASCFTIKQFKPDAMNGLYTHALDGTKFYCDMTAVKGYESIAMGEFDQTPAGYTNITATDLQNATEQAAFIALYNDAGGMKVVTAFSSGNCCFKNTTVAADTAMMFLAGADVYPSSGGVKLCSPAGGYLTTTMYQLTTTPDATPNYVANMADNFFSTFPATATVGCAVGTNPALFWKVTQ